MYFIYEIEGIYIVICINSTIDTWILRKFVRKVLEILVKTLRTQAQCSSFQCSYHDSMRHSAAAPGSAPLG